MMDEIDIKILELLESILESNGRMSHEKINQKLNMSRPAIHHRISKLEQNDIIEGYRAKINWTKVGQGIRAFVMLKVKTSNFNEIIDQVMGIETEGISIEKCFRITGQWCLMLQIRAESTEQLTKLHDELLKTSGVMEIFTILLLSETNK